LHLPSRAADSHSEAQRHRLALGGEHGPSRGGPGKTSGLTARRLRQRGCRGGPEHCARARAGHTAASWRYGRAAAV